MSRRGPRLRIGYVAGAHGVRGNLRIQLFDPNSDALSHARRVVLSRDDQNVGTFDLEVLGDIPGRRGALRTSLETVDSREAAEALKGCLIEVERDQLPELAEGEFYLSDALGLPVYRARESGELQALGTVVGISSNGLQDLLEIEWRDPSGRRYEWLVPALPAFIRTLDRDGIVVDVPHGMLPEPLDSGS